MATQEEIEAATEVLKAFTVMPRSAAWAVLEAAEQVREAAHIAEHAELLKGTRYEGDPLVRGLAKDPMRT